MTVSHDIISHIYSSAINTSVTLSWLSNKTGLSFESVLGRFLDFEINSISNFWKPNFFLNVGFRRLDLLTVDFWDHWLDILARSVISFKSADNLKNGETDLSMLDIKLTPENWPSQPVQEAVFQIFSTDNSNSWWKMSYVWQPVSFHKCWRIDNLMY